MTDNRELGQNLLSDKRMNCSYETGEAVLFIQRINLESVKVRKNAESIIKNIGRISDSSRRIVTLADDLSIIFS